MRDPPHDPIVERRVLYENCQCTARITTRIRVAVTSSSSCPGPALVDRRGPTPFVVARARLPPCSSWQCPRDSKEARLPPDSSLQ